MKWHLINLRGGQCKSCGYKDCIRCLSFHHLNPEEKIFGIDIRMINSNPYNDLVNLVNKCDVLCLNCHMLLEIRLNGEKNEK